MPELPEDKLYYSISEVADSLDVSQSLLRYWQTEFPVINPKRNKKGNRFYSHKDLDNIRLIHHLVKEQGHTLQGAKEKMKLKSNKVKEDVDIIDRLKHVRSFLVNIKDNL
jgi:DNA-binding transcriptional MerR regulator